MVVSRGFEPRKTKSADLQSALVGHLSNSPNIAKHWSNTESRKLLEFEMELVKGLEPPTRGL